MVVVVVVVVVPSAVVVVVVVVVVLLVGSELVGLALLLLVLLLLLLLLLLLVLLVFESPPIAAAKASDAADTAVLTLLLGVAATGEKGIWLGAEGPDSEVDDVTVELGPEDEKKAVFEEVLLEREGVEEFGATGLIACTGIGEGLTLVMRMDGGEGPGPF